MRLVTAALTVTAVALPGVALAGARDATYRGSGPAPAPALKECRTVDDRPQRCAPASLGSISFRTSSGFVQGLRYHARWTCTRLDRDLIPGTLRARVRISRTGSFEYKGVRRESRRGSTRSLGLIIRGKLRGNRATGTFRQFFKSSAGRGGPAACDTGTIKWTARSGR